MAGYHEDRSHAQHVKVSHISKQDGLGILLTSSPFSMKHDAIVDQGIPIHERIPIPDDLIPEDSRVEIDASEYSHHLPLHIRALQVSNSDTVDLNRDSCWLLYV